MFKLEIKTGNAAFAESPHAELVRILRAVELDVGAERLPSRVSRSIRDVNGNTVGRWSYDPETEGQS